MLGRIKQIFAAKATQPALVNSKEAAWSESSLYRAADFPKYNPDALIGRKGYAVYQKMMTDEQVKAVVRFKRDAITSRQVMFECEYQALSDEDNEFRKKLAEHIIAQMSGSFSDALNGILSSMYNGFSLTEKVFKHVEYEGRAWVGVDCLEVKPCDTFFFHVDEYGAVEKLAQKFEGKEQSLDLAKFIHFVQSPDIDKHYGRSELREAYRAYFSKDMTIKFQNIHLERFAAGFIWAAPKDGKTIQVGSPEHTALQSVMTNLQAASALILPSGIELHVEHSATTDMFERAVAQHDKAIAKALLVPNLLGITEQGSTGSYAQSETQLEAFFWTLEADSKRLEEALNEQLFRELGALNFGDDYYPKLRFKPLSERRKMEIVKTWNTLVTGKAVEATDTDEKYLREVLEFPEKGMPIVQPAPTTPPTTPPTEPPTTPPTTPPTEPTAAQLEETIVGKLGISVSAFRRMFGYSPDQPRDDLRSTAFSRAMKRVDFAVIANKADNSTKDAAYEVATINSQCVARLVALAEELKLGTAEGQPNDLQKIQYTASEMSQLKAALIKGLKDAWAIGESHAKREVQKAQFGKVDFGFNPDQPRDEAGRWSEGVGVAAQLKGSEQAAIDAYAMRSYREINMRLREGTASQMSDRQKEIVSTLDDLISRSTLGEDVTTYRIIDGKRAGDKYLKVGSVVEDKAFVSTSLNEQLAIRAVSDTGASLTSMTVVEIQVPKGARALDIGGGAHAPSIIAPRAAEAELLLPRNTRLEIISADVDSRRAVARVVYTKSFAVNDLALQDLAAAYLKQKGYTLAGDISAATQKTIRSILMEGVKVSKSAAETKKAIYKALEADGMLTEEAVVEALGASTVKNAKARIETAIRTTAFEAINEARYSYFSDPALDGFVEALEYSAILDDRTTEICSQLNGETYGIDSEVWSTFRPPNHFNCRSLLIPVTVRDTWTPSDGPTAMPQKGFGFARRCCEVNHG